MNRYNQTPGDQPLNNMQHNNDLNIVNRLDNKTVGHNADTGTADIKLTWTSTGATSAGEIRATRGANVLFMSEQVFVDPSAWYHIVWVTDTTLAEQDDRSKLYVNGERVEVNWSSSLSQGQTMSMNGPYTTYLG